MLSKFRKCVRSIPFVSSLLRATRRQICPNQSDIWWLNSRRFDRYLEHTTRTVANPVFVKVGANDGVTGDPCGRTFLDSHNWSGLLIEPVPSCFEKLVKNYHDRQRFVLEQVAIGGEAGRTKFYYVSDQAKQALPHLPEHYDMLGSFDRQHIVNHLDGVLEPFIVEVELEVQTLSAILARNQIQSIDLLHIDTEGYDLEVLRSLDLSCVRPRAIYIEYKHLSEKDRKDMVARLQSSGYKILDCGNDFFAERVSGDLEVNGKVR